MNNDIERILSGFNWPKKFEAPGFDRDAIERFVGFRLPEDYSFFLSNYVGFETFINEVYCALWDASEMISLNLSYEIQNYLPTVLCIGSDGGGELIGLEQRSDDNFSVILAPFIGMFEKESHIVIGDSFTDFLLRMESGKEWLSS